MTRNEHWATRAFHDFLLASKDKPFAWGSFDCALFAADAVVAITGTDIAGEFRGKYTDEVGAFALIKTVTGGSTVADAAAYCAAKVEMVEWTYPLMAQRGDLVVVEDSGRLIAGVVHLSGRHVAAVGEKGLMRLSIAAVKRAWRV